MKQLDVITSSLKKEMLISFEEFLDSKFEKFNIQLSMLLNTVGNMKKTISVLENENTELKRNTIIEI